MWQLHSILSSSHNFRDYEMKQYIWGVCYCLHFALWILFKSMSIFGMDSFRIKVDEFIYQCKLNMQHNAKKVENNSSGKKKNTNKN